MIVSNPKQKITAVIPIRRGSQRVKDKNLRPFGDTCLMELKISTLMQVPEIDEIIVNTNSEDAIRIVNECYAVGGGKNIPQGGVLRLVRMFRQ
ncbi:hypothetical protein [uncultured Duncaniella sp.]|uniref:cytidylyltransferase domain-containing protein n=1 Tax=uncultured Duncaniella sp. TaxID=2768039 RepID=UPI0026775411|nr:hypothetical protein [uncultured Duncaniella sp.]